VVSGFDWDPAVTDRRQWLGGFAAVEEEIAAAPDARMRGGEEETSSTAAPRDHGIAAHPDASTLAAHAALQAALGPAFIPTMQSSIPCLAWEHSRKCTLKVMSVLVWRHAPQA
jgi:hypothetical protein